MGAFRLPLQHQCCVVRAHYTQAQRGVNTTAKKPLTALQKGLDGRGDLLRRYAG